MKGTGLQVGQVGYVYGTKELPENAIILSNETVACLQAKLVRTWKPQKEMYPLLYGSHLLGVAAAVSGAIISNCFRGFMMLNTHKLAMVIPSMFFPFITTSMSQAAFVEKDSGLGISGCPSCLRVRSILIQIGFGVVQPLALSIVGGTILAKRFSTYPLPPYSDYKIMFKIYGNMLKAMKVHTAFLVGIQVLTAVVIHQKQLRAVFMLNEKMLNNEMTTLNLSNQQ